MGAAYSNGLTASSTKDTLSMTRGKGRASSVGKMAAFTMVNGSMESSTAEALSSRSTARERSARGRMGETWAGTRLTGDA